MYKKITHNIVEEHFAHPMAAELKKKVDKTVAPTPKPKVSITPEGNLHMAVHELMGKLAWGIRNYIVSTLGGIDDAAFIEASILKDIQDLSPVFTTYYSKTVADESLKHLTEFANAFCEVVKLAKAGKDYTKQAEVALSHADMLAKVLSTANPKNWPEEVVKEYLHQYATHLIAQITARMKKDWEADTLSSVKAINTIMSGPVTEGILKGMPDFANVFASGIVKQFPGLFSY
jgi:hypothetical protein